MFFFVTDLHGNAALYEKLFEVAYVERPRALFIGGDLLSAGGALDPADFLAEWFLPKLEDLRRRMRGDYPELFVILGNDDPRQWEVTLLRGQEENLCTYIHDRHVAFNGYQIFGLSYVPPTPFRLKDWERYDVSRYVDPGCTSPEGGTRTVPVETGEIKWKTIQSELSSLVGGCQVDNGIFLFHVPPYGTELDRADLDGKHFEGVKIDPHIGSIAVRRFIEDRQPLLTLHGHVHESTRLTGVWKTQIGRTLCISGAHDGPELALVRFDPSSPGNATRELI